MGREDAAACKALSMGNELFLLFEGILVFNELLSTGFIETIVHASLQQEERSGKDSHSYLSLVAKSYCFTYCLTLRHQTAKNMRRIFH